MPENDNIQSGNGTPEKNGREDPRRLKRIILMIFAGMLVFVVLFYGVAYLVEKISSSDNDRKDDDVKYDPTHQTIIFCTPDYNEDIYKDVYYMGLDRTIYYSDPGTGVTIGITKDEYLMLNAGVRFMYDFINNIIAGDAESYNECFSLDFYLSSDFEEKEAFTKQKLYNIKITKVSETIETAGTSEYVYTLEYMIRQNNGTFRTDMGSDASRIQYITINDASGKLLIANLSNVVIK